MWAFNNLFGGFVVKPDSQSNRQVGERARGPDFLLDGALPGRKLLERPRRDLHRAALGLADPEAKKPPKNRDATFPGNGDL